MEKSEIKGFIAKRCAKELKNGDVVNLGIGLPTLIPNHSPNDVELIIHAELGIVSGANPPRKATPTMIPTTWWMPVVRPSPWLSAAASSTPPPTSA